jgi:G3E family GTPase
VQHINANDASRKPGAVDEAVNQIAFADTILLNKTDLVSPEQLAETRALVRSINVTANIVETQLNNPNCPSLPSWDTLMNVNSFSIERALQVRLVWQRLAVCWVS